MSTNVNMILGRLVFQTMVISTTLTQPYFSFQASAQTSTSKEIEVARELFFVKQDCRGAWEILWPLVIQKDPEAAFNLSGMMFLALDPPLLDGSESEYDRAFRLFVIQSIPEVSIKDPLSDEFAYTRMTNLDAIWPQSDAMRKTCVSLRPSWKCKAVAESIGVSETLENFQVTISDAGLADKEAHCRQGD
jgi:hypothetical protein